MWKAANYLSFLTERSVSLDVQTGNKIQCFFDRTRNVCAKTGKKGFHLLGLSTCMKNVLHQLDFFWIVAEVLFQNCAYSVNSTINN